jgi:RHS repeat-associated protein
MKKIRNYRVLRPMASVTATVFALLCAVPPAAAFRKPELPNGKTQTPGPELREVIRKREGETERQREQARARALDQGVGLSDAQMAGMRGRGPYRNPSFSGVLPWQRSLRDVNLANGNLFKSFTDMQIAPARGAGLAWQRTYNSNDERVGPFGVGWTHAYDIRMEEAAVTDLDNSGAAVGPNKVERTDFFGGKHYYTRDADGLYSPPPYMFDELDSNYYVFLAEGAPEVSADTQRGMDGTVKHFTRVGDERVCDYIADRHGNTTSLAYTTVTIGGVSRALLATVTDPSGRVLTVTWTNLGTMMSPVYRITQVDGPVIPGTSTPVYTVSYDYNSDKNLWKVHQDPAGLNRVTTFTYTSYTGLSGTASGLLASISDPLGHTVSYTYGISPDDVLGNVWVTGVSEPASGGTRDWTISSRLIGQSGCLLQTEISDNCGMHLVLDFDYQLRNHYMGRSSPDGACAYGTSYDSSNNVTSKNFSSGILGSHSVAQGNIVVWQHFTYGPHGNQLTSEFDGISNSTSSTAYYNASKYFQKASVTDPEGHVSTFDYFDNAASGGDKGNVKWVRDARYGTTGEQFDYTYNSYGQKLTETNLNNVVTEYSYGDTWGNLTQVVQDPGMGHLNRTTSMTYDVAGRVTASTDPLSQSSSFTYNAVGQPTQASLPSETVTYTYGSNGRTATVADNRGTTTISYESGNDRVASVQDPVTGTVGYTYTLEGQRASMSLPGGNTWTYTYLPSGSFDLILPSDEPDKASSVLEKITDGQGRVVEFAFDTAGRLREVRSNQTFDQGGNLLSYQCAQYYLEEIINPEHRSRGNTATVQNIWHYLDMMGQPQSTLLVQNDYTYDDDGTRLTNALSDSGGPIRTESYGYDSLHRLTSVNYGDGTTQSYTFDPMGNRASKTQGGTTENYTYNNANMLLSRGANNYTNDANGNTLTGGGRTNTWDAQNRLTQCVYGGVTTTHTYGADGLRRSSASGGTTTNYIIDGQSAVREVQGNTIVATYLHGARGPEYRKDHGTGNVRWYLFDGLGSALGEVDGSGNITATRKYDVYGSVRASTGTSTSKHKFVGGLGHPSEDETGLVYMRARYYDPTAGRFVSEDPARHGSNLYEYAKNSPTGYCDPNGKVPVAEVILQYWKVEMMLAANLTLLECYWASGQITQTMLNYEAFLKLKPIVEKLDAFDNIQDAMAWLRQQRQTQQAVQRIRGIINTGQAAEKASQEVHDLAAELITILL